MNVGIVGSRSFEEYEFFSNVILDWEKKYGKIDTVVSGGANGVDSMAKFFAEQYGKNYIEYKPDWKKYGKAAGPIRNSLIVEASDVIIAFPKSTSTGTRDTMSKANKVGKTVHIYKIVD